ncbi:hypothetical protein BDR07DRAFT_1492564 [Suillus spraguei]|nr:hypothetical protein BDR07DRAFT_1492564 [Suillus spraguei]
MFSKKRKLSGLGGLEMQLAYGSLLKLKKAIVYKASDEQDEDEEGSEQEIDTTLILLRSKLERPESLEFSSMTMEDSKITLNGILRLKSNFDKLVAATTSLGQNEFWSSTNLYRHLHLLASLVPRTTDASPHP